MEKLIISKQIKIYNEPVKIELRKSENGFSIYDVYSNCEIFRTGYKSIFDAVKSFERITGTKLTDEFILSISNN